jgi:Fe-S-cluster formation regulator IscX/YfhJ
MLRDVIFVSLTRHVAQMHIYRIGEKFRDWSDTTPSLDKILEAVTLYWLTSTFPRAIYPYRAVCSSHQPSVLFETGY